MDDIKQETRAGKPASQYYDYEGKKQSHHFFFNVVQQYYFPIPFNQSF